jgi:exopolysaccharide biosynthesis predicted pyruvyltransferase EpsI
MESIIILGYYNRHNLGDDLFQYVLKKQFPKMSILFANPDDINSIPSHVSIILVGGGDLLNDYFMTKIRKLVYKTHCPVYGIGIGCPYPKLLNKEYLDIFDIILTRTKSCYDKLQQVLPGRAFYGPDLVRMLPSIPKKKTNKVGIFFANSICSPDSPLVQKLADIVNGIANKSSSCKGHKYHVILYAMNTSGSTKEDDNILNRAVYKYVNQDVDIIEKPIKPEEAVSLFSEFQATVCTRFHAHILSLMTNTPFVSLFSTKKVKDLLQSENLSYLGTEMLVDSNTLRPIDFNPKDVLDKFELIEKCKPEFQKVNTDDIELGIKNLLYYKPKFGEKRYNKIICKICKYLKVEKNELQNYFKDCDPNFAAEVITFCITRTQKQPFTWGLSQKINNNFNFEHEIKWILNNIKDEFYHWETNTLDRKYNFEYFDRNLLSNLHRSGWQYVVDHLWNYQNPKGIIFDVYLDKTFGWKKDFFKKIGILPFKRRWIGVFHHTPNESYSLNNLNSIVSSSEFKNSLNKCQGIIVLSNYLKEWFEVRIPNIKIHLLYHPSEFVNKKWSFQNWKNNKDKKIIQIGAWLRDSYGIFALSSPKGVRKCALKGPLMNNYFPPENYFDLVQDAVGINCDGVDGPCRVSRQNANKFMVGMLDHLKDSLKKVEIIEQVTNDEYDILLQENIVFIKLIDASACNTIIECIIRSTPILVNRLPAVVEYLGSDYPLYYNTLEEARDLAENDDMILKAYKYLENKDKTFLKIKTFLENFNNISF